MPETTVSTLVAHVARLLAPLRTALAGPEQATSFLNALGWELPPGVSDIGLTSVTVTGLVDKALILARTTDAEWDDEILVATRVAEVAVEIVRVTEALVTVMEAIDGLPGVLPDYIARTRIDRELAGRALDYLVGTYLRESHFIVHELLRFGGFLEQQSFPVDPASYQTAHTRYVLRAERLGALFDPDRSWPAEVYGWGTPAADVAKLLENLAGLLVAMGSISHAGTASRALEEAAVGRPAPEADADPAPTVTLTLIRALAPDTLRAGLIALALRPSTTGGADGGVAVLPFITGSSELVFPLPGAEAWSLVLVSSVDLAGGVVISLRPDTIRVLSAIFGGGAPAPLLSGEVLAGLRFVRPDGSRQDLLTLPGGTGLSIERAQALGGAELTAEGLGGAFQLVLEGGRVDIGLGEGDAFLTSVVSLDAMAAEFDLGILYSQSRGLHFTGSGSIETTLGIHVDLGPFRLETLHLILSIAAEGLTLEASVSGSGAIGPASAAVERVGVRSILRFQRGNLGPLDLGFAFKPPTGFGVALTAGPVSGGGFVSLDDVNHRYVGILQLDVLGVAVTAIAIIETRLPDGREGYSFLIIIAVEFTPIQLGYGFTLNGVGGLAGIHRSVDVEALRAGIYQGSLDSILFPRDPVANAPRLISDLTRIFPVAEGQYTFGPMAKLGWGTPTLVHITLGIVIELPNPVRIALLGQIAVYLPDTEAAIVELHIDFVAIIDFAAQLLSLDATLRDSRILAFTLSGDMAMRLSWGEQPNFALAMGGLHPAFQPPPGFPTLRRLTLALGAGDYLRLTCQAYQAVTSNSVQLGARVELYVNVGVYVHGWLGFDALFVLSPFSFQVDFTAGLEIGVGSVRLAGVSVEGTLSGPTPWRIRGRATISVLFFEVTARVDERFGSEEQAVIDERDPWPPLLAALADPRNWAAAPAPGAANVVSLHTPREGAPVLVDPVGRATWRERVAPLNRTLTRFGSSAPPAPVKFTVDRVTIGGATASFSPVEDFFAPAQFEALSDAQKLSRPSFERMQAGVEAGGGGTRLGPSLPTEIEYETRIIDSTRESRPAPSLKLSARAQRALGAMGTLGETTMRTAGLRAFAGERRFSETTEGFVIAATTDLSLRADITGATTKGAAFQALDAYLAEHPEEHDALQVMPLADLEAA